MIIHCKIYFGFFLFYFRGLRKPRKYFYNENFQIYGMYVCIYVCMYVTGLQLKYTSFT